MEPIEETREAVEEFGPFGDRETELLDHLTRSADQVRDVVPSCVGLTFAVVREGLAFTLVATDSEVAVLDAVQYLDSGPCLSAAEEAAAVVFETADPLDERRWTSFARISAARGVATTLTLPILKDNEVTGSINLYASSPNAFGGHHETLAAIFGAWPEGAVSDADLSFATRRTAQETPARLRGQVTVSQAAGRLMAARHLGPDQAVEQLAEAAARAGVDVVDLAAVVLAAEDLDDVVDLEQPGQG